MKKATALIIILTMLFTFYACTGKKTNKNDVDSLSVCLASEPDTLDPALNSTADGATLCAHLFSGLAKWSKDENGTLHIVADAAEELTEGVRNQDGTVTYTYKLKDGLLWSDGQPLTAKDFVFAWNRAASPELAADYHYMFDAIKGYSEMWATDTENAVSAESEARLAVTAADDRTLVVTLKNEVNYWNELIAFPTYYPVREDVVTDDSWASRPETYISNGPYTMSEWKHNSVITLKKNNQYSDSESVKMPEIRFFLSDDTNNMLANFKNGDWKFIDNIPTNEIKQIKEEYSQEFNVTNQLGTYYLSWNINEDILPDTSNLKGEAEEKAEAEVRKAISLLIDRNYIVKSITQCNEIPAPAFISSGIKEPDGTEFYKNSGSSGDYSGYFNVLNNAAELNYTTAINTLKKYYHFDRESGMFTDFPPVIYIYNTSDNHRAIAEYIQSALQALGITVNLENQEWNTFLNTRKSGDYTLARNGWVADYNDPLTFLDMWTSSSGNNDVQFGKGKHADLKLYNLDLTDYNIDIKVRNGTWAETYDVLIKEIKYCSDIELRYKLMHIAEDMLMDTGCITPIYYNTDPYLISNSVSGFYANPLGYKYFMNTTINE